MLRTLLRRPPRCPAAHVRDALVDPYLLSDELDHHPKVSHVEERDNGLEALLARKVATKMILPPRGDELKPKPALMVRYPCRPSASACTTRVIGTWRRGRRGCSTTSTRKPAGAW